MSISTPGGRPMVRPLNLGCPGAVFLIQCQATQVRVVFHLLAVLPQFLGPEPTPDHAIPG